MESNALIIEINVICIVLLLMTRFTINESNKMRMKIGAFLWFIQWFVVFCVIDILLQLMPDNWVLIKRLLLCAKTISCAAIPLSWFHCVYYMIKKSSYGLRKQFPLVFGPFILICIYSLADLLFGEYDPNAPFVLNFGTWIALNVVCIGYVTAAVIMTSREVQRCKNRLLRKNYYQNAFLMYIPIAATLAQPWALDMPITTPVLALVIIFQYFNTMKMKISIDPVSGVNNTNKLADYLGIATQNLDADKRLFYVLLSINHFKEIRKRYGRIKTEEVLEQAGDFLKEQCTKPDVFLARSGESEFVLICEKRYISEIETICDEIIRNTDCDEMKEVVPIPITFSIYWSEYGTEKTSTIDEWMDEARNNCIMPPTELPSNLLEDPDKIDLDDTNNN